MGDADKVNEADVECVATIYGRLGFAAHLQLPTLCSSISPWYRSVGS